MFLTVKELSKQLQIKPSTLYAWAAQGKIPCRRIHGLIRFDPEAISPWLRSFTEHQEAPPRRRRKPAADLDEIIARAQRGAYNPAHGETRPTASPSGKEGKDGAR